MDLASEVNEQIRAFVRGMLVARELEGWLDSIAAEIHADGDPNLRARTDRVLTLLAEVDYGHRTSEDVRRELAAVGVGAVTVDTHPGTSPGLEGVVIGGRVSLIRARAKAGFSLRFSRVERAPLVHQQLVHEAITGRWHGVEVATG